MPSFKIILICRQGENTKTIIILRGCEYNKVIGCYVTVANSHASHASVYVLDIFDTRII